MNKSLNCVQSKKFDISHYLQGSSSGMLNNLLPILMAILCIMIIITAIIIICFTTPKSEVKKCELNFVRKNSNPIEYNYGPQAVSLGDFNNDSWMDMVIVNSLVNQIDIYFGLNDETFSKEFSYSTGISSNPIMSAVNDLNKDSYLDIVVANYGRHSIGIFYGYVAGQRTYSTGNNSYPYSVAAGYFNDDVQLDLVTANFGSNTIGVFLGSDNNSFISQRTYSTGSYSSPYSVAVGYFNNDTRLDIIVINYDNSKFGIFLGHGDGTFDGIILFSMPYGSHPFSLALADFNRNGKLDIAVINNGTDSLSLYLQTC
ncbi:unnamed protein product [Adineta ricciae]|uniref:Uncharacterized protein n=1 Tax=Adineta ricciae TaxID=249248 RepID=A0A815ECP5_ADIRI|nr:unnamed protein product [Adineta ricciae]